jgi:methyl-accepting chemotaxis protein
MKIKMNLRTKFVWTFASLSVITVTVLMLASYWIASHAVESQTDASMEETVQQTTADLDAWLADRMKEAHFLAEIEVLKAACRGQQTNEALARLESYQKLSPAYENLFLADTNGVLFLDSIGGKSIGIELKKHPVFALNAEKARQGEQWISEVQASPATGRPVCLITTPIMENGVFIGIAGTPLELRDFSDNHVRGVKVGKTGYIAITDNHGIALAHPNPDLVLKFNLAEQEWGRQALAQKNGKLEYVFNGLPRIAHIATDKNNGWLVLAILPRSEISQTVSAIRDAAVVLGLGAVTIVIAATWLLTGNLIRRVRGIVVSLTAGANQTASAADQVSAASQTLAEGSGEQAASIEETSSSLEEMASMTKRNAENAQKANDLAKQARQARTKAPRTCAA